MIRKSEFVARTQFLYFPKEILSVPLYAMMTITSNEGKRSFSLLKRILHYTRCTMTRADLTILHLWLTTEKIIEIFVQANHRKLKLKIVGEYVDGVNSI